MKVSELVYQNEVLAFRVEKENKDVIGDVSILALTEEMKDYLKEVSTEQLELYIKDNQLVTTKELKGYYTKPVKDVSESFSFIIESILPVVSKDRAVKPHYLYTKNGALFVPYTLTFKATFEKLCNTEVVGDLIVTSPQVFDILVEQGYLDEDDRPKKYPHLYITGLTVNELLHFSTEYVVASYKDTMNLFISTPTEWFSSKSDKWANGGLQALGFTENVSSIVLNSTNMIESTIRYNITGGFEEELVDYFDISKIIDLIG